VSLTTLPSLSLLSLSLSFIVLQNVKRLNGVTGLMRASA
jgi:hypothetical protein